ncbi:YPDG domain-containing protein, partial [Mammaliicoccus vitulinus]
LPDGWTATVDPNTGTVTVTSPESAVPNEEVTIPVKVKYPDGSIDDAPVKVSVIPNDAQSNNPTYGDNEKTLKPGKTIEIPQTGDNQLPPNTVF